MNEDPQNIQLDTRAQLFGSLLQFTQVFYKIRTGRDFNITQPVSCESHYIQICRALTKVFKGESQNLNINIAPRYGKTELLCHFVSWALAQYPDCNFIYASYSHGLATKATSIIRDIISLYDYKRIFGVKISDDSGAKDNFMTTAGGSVFAAGTAGTITGFGSGIKGVTDRFSGCFIIDDSVKPSEAPSDTIRQGVIDWWFNTAHSRMNNGSQTPVVNIGQRTHEYDLPSKFLQNPRWTHLVLKTLYNDDTCALDPSMHSVAELLDMKEKMPYDFAAQYQQDPIPSGGSIFKEEWFHLTDEEPRILKTFITVDTAETDKTYNDKTVFSFFGIYKVLQSNVETDQYAIHWIDCVELNIEPVDLYPEFKKFHMNCMIYKVKPDEIAIEKKSSGATLISAIKRLQGYVPPIEIDRPAGISKASRFLDCQPFVARRLVSLPRLGKHTKMCIDHMRKITLNMTHRWDDIADTLEMAIKLALIDKSISLVDRNKEEEDRRILHTLMSGFNQCISARGRMDY